MSCLTVIDTKKISNITTSTLDTGGINLISAEPIVEKGVVYSYTNFFPTIANDRVICPNKGVGKFNITLTGLSAGFTYYVRAYAVNNKGEIGYGRTLEATVLTNSVGGCTMVTTLFPGKIYTIPTGYTLVGSDANGSLISNCIDVTTLEKLTPVCYGCKFSIDFLDTPTPAYQKFYLHGFRINDIDYIYENGYSYFVISSSVYLYEYIQANAYLSTILKEPCIALATNNQNGTFIASFKSPVDLTNSFLIIRTSGEIGGTETIMYLPLLKRTDPSISSITQCPCTS